MLDMTQIESYYPEKLRPFRKNILREYLQYKMLEIIFTSPFAGSLGFMGGTAIRIVHAGTRFSEDLDFDNRSLDRSGFENLSGLIEKRFALEGYEVEVKNTMRTAFRSSVRISGILQETGISRHRDEKLAIRIDAEPQDFDYKPQGIIMNKFGIFTRIHAVPVDILLAQKIACIFTRKRAVGRDFYDIIFLMGKTSPNMDYIGNKLDIHSGAALKKKIIRRCRELDFQALSKDLAPFLINPSDSVKIISFPDYISTIKF
jgi:predicted nucleotidyltransferase component of viral defense system